MLMFYTNLSDTLYMYLGTLETILEKIYFWFNITFISANVIDSLKMAYVALNGILGFLE